MAEKQRMVIFTEGGLIQEIFTDFPTDVIILDADLNDSGDEITLIKDTDEKENSYVVSTWDVPGEPKLTEHFAKQARSQGDENEKPQ